MIIIAISVWCFVKIKNKKLDSKLVLPQNLVNLNESTNINDTNTNANRNYSGLESDESPPKYEDVSNTVYSYL